MQMRFVDLLWWIGACLVLALIVIAWIGRKL